jgi:SsrA-binding protein
MSKKKSDDGIKVVTQNKKARHEYFVDSSIEAGIVLVGSEVKSLRDGRANLSDAYAIIDDRGECYLLNAHISHYPPAAMLNHEPKRTRKLLLHAEEIAKLMNKLNEKGYTIIPLKLYFKRGRAKVELGLCKGKRKYDKRAAIKKRESDREVSRALHRKY